MAAPDICLRNGQRRDIPRMVELLTDPQVRAHLGGPRPRAVAWPLAIATSAMARCSSKRWAQIIADTTTGQMLGTVMVDRRAPDRPGHVRETGNELELSYVLLPDAWGRGIAGEACRQILTRVAADVPGDEPVVVVTQTSNQKALALAKRLGFDRCDEFTEFGAQQTMLSSSLETFRC